MTPGPGPVARDIAYGPGPRHTADVYAPGRTGTALRFDNNTRGTIPYAPGFTWGNDDDDFTVAYWLYVEAGPNGRWRNLFHKSVSDTPPDGRTSAAWLFPTSMALTSQVSTTSSWGDGVNLPEIPLMQWVHVADVKRGRERQVFVNGASLLTTAVSPTLGNRGPLLLGGDPPHGGFAGRLDDFRVYRRALRADEVTALAREPGALGCPAWFADCDADARNGCEANLRAGDDHCGVCGNACATGSSCRAGVCVAGAERGLLAHYRFDETAAGAIADSSGNGFDGTATAGFAPGRVGNGLQVDFTVGATVPYT
jgi:hypothetical protein